MSFTNPNTPSIKTFKPVVYYPGITVFNQKSAVIAWTDDNRIILDIVNEQNQPIERIFNVALNEITFVRVSQTVMTVVIGANKYRLDFNPNARFAMAGGGVVGLGIAASLAKKSGIFEWKDAFKNAGVTVKYISLKKVVLITVPATLVFIAIVVVIVAATTPQY